MNTSQSKSAKNSTKTPARPKLKPDFSHRLGLFNSEATALNLSDAVDTLTLQAENTIALLSSQFLGEEQAVKSNDDVFFWTLESVRLTIKDIKSIVNAFHEANGLAESVTIGGE
jgi:hypothetical protein